MVKRLVRRCDDASLHYRTLQYVEGRLSPRDTDVVCVLLDVLYMGSPFEALKYSISSFCTHKKVYPTRVK